MILRIDRKKWLRDEGSRRSKLLRGSDGKMCCLGFYSLACGLKEKDIRNFQSPSDIWWKNIPEPHSKFMKSLVMPGRYFYQGFVNSNYCNRLMELNDNEKDGESMNLSADEQEGALIYEFGKIGVEVEFYN